MKFSTRLKRRRGETENERQDAKQRLYTAVVESSGNAIMTQTFDGTITAWNPAAERLYGYTAQEAIGKNINLIRPEDRREEIRSILAKVQQGETVDYLETVRIKKEGRQINVSL